MPTRNEAAGTKPDVVAEFFSNAPMDFEGTFSHSFRIICLLLFPDAGHILHFCLDAYLFFSSVYTKPQPYFG